MMRFGACCPVVVMSLQNGFDEARDQVGTMEKVVYEINENFDDLSQGTLQCRFNAIVNIENPTTPGTDFAEFNVYIGGAINTVDGTNVATIQTVIVDPTEEQQTDLGVSFTNPAMGQQLVKITAKASVAGATANIRGAKYVIG
jgi:hypothetical protein